MTYSAGMVALVAFGCGPGLSSSSHGNDDVVIVYAQRLANASATHEVAQIRSLLNDPVMSGGLWFADQACATKFGAGGEIAGANVDTFAACLGQLGLQQSARLDALPDVAVLTYAPGFEVEARFVGQAGARKVTWIGYAARLERDRWPTITTAALEALRTAGDRNGPIDPTKLPPGAKPRAWLKVCVDATGAVTDANLRETTSTPGGRAFVAAALGWHFRPFLLRDQPVPVCAMVSMKYPPVPASNEPEELPIPMPMKGDQVLVPQEELKRIEGVRGVVPDDSTRTALQQMGVSELIGSFKICLDETGHPTEVSLLQTTRSRSYDEKIIQTMKHWVYAPAVIDGKPTPVCTAVTFIYTQK